MDRQAALLLGLASVAAIASGMIGCAIWLIDLDDRGDGDALRLGHWHNPIMQFPPFNEPFLDASMWVLLACSAAAGLGGVMLLCGSKRGISLVVWQARASIAINGAIALLIVATLFVFAEHQWDEWHLGGTPKALALRLGSVGVDLVLWAFVGSRAARDLLVRQSHPPGRAFGVILQTPVEQADRGADPSTTS